MLTIEQYADLDTKLGNEIAELTREWEAVRTLRLALRYVVEAEQEAVSAEYRRQLAETQVLDLSAQAGQLLAEIRALETLAAETRQRLDAVLEEAAGGAP